MTRLGESLVGKRVLVTQARDFMGPALVECFREHGATVVTGVDPLAALKHNDSYGVFSAIGDLLITGPTGTNVSDIFIGLANY